ncbi:hypothetical protein [Haloprofundus salilacus]|uniref:hypothetical protein n=1 Tax=Haloprofundus salilacus TaxID=2876190 RepID=UPI001CCDA565|nr:hypothetical protein [Haloprofundus salilacus]
MSFSTTPSESDSPSERIEAAVDRANSAAGDASDSSLTGTAKELVDVLVAGGALLDSIDFERLPEVVEKGQLPALVDVDHLADAIRERDPDLAFDLSNLEKVVNTRELWNSIDLLEFGKAKRRLDRELEDVPEIDSSKGVDSDSEAVEDAKEFTDSLRPEAKRALVHQEAAKRLKVARKAVIAQHTALERVYASNPTHSGSPAKKRTSRNPTAVSLRPSGPLPNGVSTRVSTVPAAVPYSEIDALPRIYGRRWRGVESERKP